MLCEIHRRKTHHHHHQQVHHQFGLNLPPFFPFPPHDSDELPNCFDSPPRGVPTRNNIINDNTNTYNTVTALSEDNERLRRSNNMLMSELAHMKKLYNDIIYFVQNHVKPVAPSHTYPSLLLCNNSTTNNNSHINNVSTVQRPVKQFVACYSNNSKQARTVNSPTNSSITIVEDEPISNSSKTKLFGVSLQSKKRVHPEYGSNNLQTSETNKARLLVENDDFFGLNLMPPSTC